MYTSAELQAQIASAEKHIEFLGYFARKYENTLSISEQHNLDSAFKTDYAIIANAKLDLAALESKGN